MSKIYRLIPLINLDKTAQLQVLKIRNEKHIREWMFTGDEINIDDHFAWIEKIKNDQSQICLIIIDDNTQPIGAVNIKKIDKINKNAELGFYKSNDITEKGLMIKSLSVVISYSFDFLSLEKIYSEVFENNIKSLNVHRKLSFVEEGFLRSHIVNNGRRIGIYLFGLLKNEWNIYRNKIDLESDFVVEINNV